MIYRRFVPYRDRPLCFLDVEGTGTEPGFHEITEIGIRHSKLGDICVQIKPEMMDRAEPDAIAISRYNDADWADAKSFKYAIPDIIKYFEDATIVGHNIFGYDIPMLKGNFEICDISHENLFRDCIDTMSLARTFLVPLGLNMVSMKSCMKFIGEEYDGAHNAYQDALFVEKLYNFIIKNLKWHGKVDGKSIQENLF